MKNYEPAFVIIRTDPDFPTPTVKEVVWTLKEAEDEVKRLNKLNGDKGCVYNWQYTRVKTKAVA